MTVRLVLGLLFTVAALAIAGRRVRWLSRLVRTGQPAPGRMAGVPARLRAELAEVLGQRKLLTWSVPGVAHFLTFWGFIVLILTIIEAWGGLFDRNFHIPGIGRWAAIGFIEDLFAVGVLVGIVTFAILRIRQAPARRQRDSRFYGSHTRAAWVILGMIALVIITLLIYRGAQINTGVFPFGDTPWAFASWTVAKVLHPLGESANDVIETVFLLGNVAVILAFLVIVVYSKHLHIALAPLNVGAKRVPDGLGPLLPVTDAAGKPIDFEDAENLDEDQAFGRGKIEDFTWKGMLDFATCTECGRCQSQCPAWNTGKPLSPKLVIMDLRDHLFAKAPYLLAGSPETTAATGVDEGGPEAAEAGAAHGGVPESGFWRVPQPGAAQAGRPLVGTAEEGGVIDPDVLWSCTTCGACVEQCPVDIEHVDHIVDMRRYQVLMESQFPKEAHTLLRNLERAGDPWGRGSNARLEWMAGLPFEVRVLDDTLPDDVEYLLWVGCAGSLDDKAKRTTRALAELLHEASVEFMVLGGGETCTGDPARRLGQEALFQELAKTNVETLNEAGAKKIVVTCAHCFNALANEYPQVGGHYEVVHHTQLLAKLVADGRLKPVHNVDAEVTYHDPCYLGRHNRIFSPPRDILGSVPGVQFTEMPRNQTTSFCCGAGGARMWMEEKIGTRINETRTDEALGTGASVVAAACPYCIIMLTDGVNTRKQEGKAADEVRVADVSDLLLKAVRGTGSGGATTEGVE